MAMSFFKRRSVIDPELGELIRTRGYWRGHVAPDGEHRVPLSVVGTRDRPSEFALVLARRVTIEYESWQAQAELALFHHYAPYRDAAGDDVGVEPAPDISEPAAVWPFVSLEYVLVEPIGGILTTELGYACAWDQEHTLGARFQGDGLVELCGSTLSP